MRALSTLVSAAAASVAVFLLAPDARADGFYITLSNGVTSQRLWGATFDSTTSTPVTYSASGQNGHVSVTPVHIELDDWNSVEAIAAAGGSNKTFDAKVEFTQTVGGSEQVYLIETFTRCRLTEWDGIFTAGGSPVVTQKFNFAYLASQFTVPPSAPATASKTAPTVLPRRVGLPRPLGSIALAVNSAQITAAPTSPAVASDGITSVTFGYKVPLDGVGNSLHSTASTLIVTKDLDVATGAFQKVLNTHTALRPVTIDFLGGTSKLFTLRLNDTSITADSQNVSGGKATESVTFAATSTGETLTDVGGNATASF
jgi:type VI protein secretion system component Hcp